MKDTSKTSHDIEKAYNDKLYIVTRYRVYQPFYSVNAGYYAMPVYRSQEPLAGSGRFYHMSGAEVNRMIGYELLNEL